MVLWPPSVSKSPPANWPVSSRAVSPGKPVLLVGEGLVELLALLALELEVVGVLVVVLVGILGEALVLELRDQRLDGGLGGVLVGLGVDVVAATTGGSEERRAGEDARGDG